ncbi:MAG: hypothetical protein LQ341_005127 [Variospora aurantia]|nr:MAG: hypothetical protein LQ341_005127 [Variospora aurantia]
MSTSLYTPETPATVREAQIAQGLHLITQSTPNGQKVQILLEELKDVYNTQWTTTLVDIRTNVQKSDWFLRLNPNGRIPIIIDNTQSAPFPVMETSAELLYLLKVADQDDVFGFRDELERSQYAISRFRTETLRNFNVLEIRLSGKYTGEPSEYLAGKGRGKYSVADMSAWPWVKAWKFSGFREEDMEAFPHLMKWVDRIAEREAVQRALGEKYATTVEVVKQAGAGNLKGIFE